MAGRQTLQLHVSPDDDGGMTSGLWLQETRRSASRVPTSSGTKGVLNLLNLFRWGISSHFSASSSSSFLLVSPLVQQVGCMNLKETRVPRPDVPRDAKANPRELRGIGVMLPVNLTVRASQSLTRTRVTCNKWSMAGVRCEHESAVTVIKSLSPRVSLLTASVFSLSSTCQPSTTTIC